MRLNLKNLTAAEGVNLHSLVTLGAYFGLMVTRVVVITMVFVTVKKVVSHPLLARALEVYSRKSSKTRS